MNIPNKQRANGFSMPVYGLGTWGIGGKYQANSTNDQTDITTIRQAIDFGVRHIDTAESYGAGHAEQLVGKAIKGYDRRELFLVSKVSYDNLGYDDICLSAQASLERLGTDYLDLFLLHRFNPHIPIEETMAAMDSLVEEGLVRNIGVSNFTIERFRMAQAVTENPLVANQLHLNVQYREAERRGLLEYCQENDVLFVAWRPLQKGMLAGEIPILMDLAEKYDKTPAQIALNWLISQDNVVAVAKTGSIEHLQENLGAVGWEMEVADVEKLRHYFPNQQNISDTVPLDYT